MWALPLYGGLVNLRLRMRPPRVPALTPQSSGRHRGESDHLSPALDGVRGAATRQATRWSEAWTPRRPARESPEYAAPARLGLRGAQSPRGCLNAAAPDEQNWSATADLSRPSRHHRPQPRFG